MPDHDFLIVGGVDKIWVDKFKSQKNVRYVPWTDSMKNIYKKTKLLLVPSTWPEPFGRVVLEAEINGVPVISSRVGGLPEAVGDGGETIIDNENPKKWVEQIKHVLDEDNYLKYSKKAIKHAKKFLKEAQMKKFLNAITKVISR